MDEKNKSEDNGLPSDKPQGNGLASDGQSHRQSRKVDEIWKDNVEKEKAQLKDKLDNSGLPSDKPQGNGLASDGPSHKQSQKGQFDPPVVDFKFFVTTLALQASIALGHMANPATEKVEEDLAQAKFLVDTLGMLQEKTKNNLTKDETQLFDNLLYELRVAYLAKGKGEIK